MLHIYIIHTILSTFSSSNYKKHYYYVIGKYAKMRGSVKIAGFRP